MRPQAAPFDSDPLSASAFVTPLGRDRDRSERKRVDDCLNLGRGMRMSGRVGKTDLERQEVSPVEGVGLFDGVPVRGQEECRAALDANDVMIVPAEKRT